MLSEYDRPRCPKDGRYVSGARAIANDERLVSVTGDCATHGVVLLGQSWWNWDLWFSDEDD